jgi:tetratricopeptide (TPR) repeat protein
MRSGILIIGLLSMIAMSPGSLLAQTNGSFAANHDRGEIYIKRHDLASAVIYLQRAYNIDPDNQDNAYDLALAYLEQGQVAQSREIVAAALAAHDRADFRNLLGEIEAKEGHIEAAAEQYRTAAQMDPTEKNLFDLGSHLLQYHGFEAALTVFSYAVQRYPKSAELSVGLGIADYSLGKYDDSIDQLCRAVDLNPSDTRAFDFLGKMYNVAPGKAAEVTARLARFAREYPNNATALYYYALSLRRRSDGQFEPENAAKAQELLERSVKLNPSFADAHFELGLLYDDEKEDAKAIQEYLAAINLEPEPSKFHYRLARVYQRNGNSQMAAVEYRKFEELKAHEAKFRADLK